LIWAKTKTAEEHQLRRCWPSVASEMDG